VARLVKHIWPDIRVLVIDDSNAFSYLIKSQLVSLGVAAKNILLADTCQSAIRAIKTHRFDLIIMDYHLEWRLTGYELAALLYRNKLINYLTGVLIVSGDTRQETVQTALSGKVRHFMAKPIQTRALADKIQIILSESREIYSIKRAFFGQSHMNYCRLLDALQTAENSVAVEAYFLDDLLRKSQWDLVQLCIVHSSTPLHVSKICAIAYLLDHQEQTAVAIQELQQFLDEHPLSLKVMDCLSRLYAKMGHNEQALLWARKAFELTPSLSERAIWASRLAAEINHREEVIKIGYTFANQLSFAETRWIQSVSEYFSTVETVYIQSVSEMTKRELLQHLNNFVQIAGRRFTRKRILQLQTLKLLFQCHILIHERHLKLAHQKLLQAIAPYYDNLARCPNALMRELMPALAYFGELWLYHFFQKILEKRTLSHPGNRESQARFFCYQPIPKIEGLFNAIPKQKQSIDWSHSLPAFERIMADYPYATEAKIYYLYAATDQSTAHQMTASRSARINQIVSDLMQLELPSNWQYWVAGIYYSGIHAEPPKPLPLLRD
jgi:CheY-like chemotaxis protein